MSATTYHHPLLLLSVSLTDGSFADVWPLHH
jgi:hypothetical protein